MQGGAGFDPSETAGLTNGDDFVMPLPGARRLNSRGGIDVLGVRSGQGEDDFDVLA